jgi:hypothetical protein
MLTPYRLKMDTIFMISRVHYSVKIPLNSLSSSPGAHAHPLCYPRRSKRRSAKRYENTAKPLTNRISTRRIWQTRPSLTTGDACWRNGAHGVQRSRRHWCTSLMPRKRPRRRKERLLRISRRKSLMRRRRLCSEVRFEQVC